VSASVYRTRSEEETIELGRHIAARLTRPCLILLIGNLGAGKTTITKGIVAGLGAAPVDEVSSPTYTVIHEYGNDVYHIDLYRLDAPEQVPRLGLDEMFDRGAVMLVEWGDAYRDVLPHVPPVEIRITREVEDRVITIDGIADPPVP
jgi:tRNA threonylcarbamoyladenosine biosynthesis protein TsaE